MNISQIPVYIIHRQTSECRAEISSNKNEWEKISFGLIKVSKLGERIHTDIIGRAKLIASKISQIFYIIKIVSILSTKISKQTTKNRKK